MAYLQKMFWIQRILLNNIKGIVNNNYLVVLKRDKDSSEFIIDKSDYYWHVSKVHKMIDESINTGI